MTAPYSLQTKMRALDLLAHCDDVDMVSAETGIARRTLRRWKQQRREIRAAHLLEQVERLHTQLAENAVHLSAALADSIEGAPLNQVSTALGTVIDRYLKIDEHLEEQIMEEHGEVIQVVYEQEDGTFRETPPWATFDHGEQEAVPGGRLWPPVWKNRDRQNGHLQPRARGRHDLVAGPDLRDGERGMERSEDSAAEREKPTHQRERAAD